MSNAGRSFASNPELLADPYAFYRMLRAGGRACFVPGLFGGAWIVTSHEIASSVLRSKQFIKEGHTIVAPERLAALPRQADEFTERRRHNMIFRDPPAHTRLRGLVTQAFTPRMVERLRPRIVDLAEELLDSVAPRGQMDLIADFAFPLPIIVIAELLGVPPADRNRLKEWSTDLTATVNPAASDDDMARASSAAAAFDDYMRAVVEERRREPRADLISDLIRVQQEGDRLTTGELLMTCKLLLSAGHETTVNLIGNGMLALLQHPEQRVRLAADPSLLPNAVEELLRYDGPVQMTMRFAGDSLPLGAASTARGDFVVVLLGAANRDLVQFSDPDVLDITRANAHTHLAFGAGIHYCLGGPLARIEGEIAIGALLRRLPTLALTGAPLAWRSNPVLRGLRALPVTF